jgi:hypothetical protein
LALYGYLGFVRVSFSNLFETAPVLWSKVNAVVFKNDLCNLGTQVGGGLVAIRRRSLEDNLYCLGSGIIYPGKMMVSAYIVI